MLFTVVITYRVGLLVVELTYTKFQFLHFCIFYNIQQRSRTHSYCNIKYLIYYFVTKLIDYEFLKLNQYTYLLK